MAERCTDRIDEERLFGCLVGQAVGDALGLPVEGRTAQVCAPYAAELRQTDPGFFLRAASGQYSDDTQLARELLLSFVACGGFDPADFGDRIGILDSEGRAVGVGRSTRAAALRLASGIPWQDAAAPPFEPRNGGAMRAAPVGLLYQEDAVRRRQTAATQAQITHPHLRSIAGAVAIAEAAALAHLSEPAACGFVEQVAAATAPFDPGFAAAIERLPQWRLLSPEAALGHILAHERHGSELASTIGVPPLALPSVLWALYAFLRTPDDYRETIGTAIWPGGDVDTTAAMAGAVSGARLGPDGVPAALVEWVNDRGEWRGAALRDLCSQAAAVADACDRTRSDVLSEPTETA